MDEEYLRFSDKLRQSFPVYYEADAERARKRRFVWLYLVGAVAFVAWRMAL